ncbi:helix-turn-helix transcriptional regulator [Streptomonospora nanhaiensis]|uniref:Putative DNA-binding transcriptional regulator YafY n=1 Tax=Streptomonospora nanhaiensis TaxID=1323731 RepID=A0A853BFY8_9ACTN|nr:YafY family protein [Streptomonospora nanhaiensis]MBV2366424.1 YafY family transcriptional regulator [Streptomonospora nanhaiensis]NYI94243.1 putative DNA-binding transcriptional regulator YafY [Streptomonospora nanhaiensis]
MPGGSGSDAPGRLLRLLSLLQARREWSGAELAERLEVTDRTVRRDVERLRALGYLVEGVPGTAGGYRMAAGRDMPPLLLEDEEAAAVALGLATVGGTGPAGLADSALRALAKLERLLPARLRPRLAALGTATAAVARPDAPPVDPAALARLAACCREHEVLAFDYRDRSGRRGQRRVEPHSLVTVHGRWYLIAFDTDRADWRTFRVDRIERTSPTRHRFAPRDLPGGDPAAYLTASMAAASYRHRAVVAVEMGARELAERLFTSMPGWVEERGPGACAVHLSAEEPELVVRFVAAVGALGAPFRVEDSSAEVAERVRELGRRLAG